MWRRAGAGVVQSGLEWINQLQEVGQSIILEWENWLMHVSEWIKLNDFRFGKTDYTYIDETLP